MTETRIIVHDGFVYRMQCWLCCRSVGHDQYQLLFLLRQRVGAAVFAKQPKREVLATAMAVLNGLQTMSSSELDHHPRHFSEIFPVWQLYLGEWERLIYGVSVCCMLRSRFVHRRTWRS